LFELPRSRRRRRLLLSRYRRGLAVSRTRFHYSTLPWEQMVAYNNRAELQATVEGVWNFAWVMGRKGREFRFVIKISARR
jgi:hypothetical protein